MTTPIWGNDVLEYRWLGGDIYSAGADGHQKLRRSHSLVDARIDRPRTGTSVGDVKVVFRSEYRWLGGDIYSAGADGHQKLRRSHSLVDARIDRPRTGTSVGDVKVVS